MTNGSHIRAVGREGAQDAPEATVAVQGEEPVTLEEEWNDLVEDPAPRRRWIDWLVPTAAILAIAGWTAFFAWTFQSELRAGTDPQGAMVLLVNWAIPTLLVCSIWLLAMRLSRREAVRFGDTALLLRQEATALENRLTIVNRELSLAREFLAAQSRELESFGRIASDRLSTHASELQSLVQTNGAQVEAIATVSDTALANMAKLRDDLPVIAASTRDVSNQIGQAGRTAHDQLDKLVAGFERLNEFGQASGAQVATLSQQVETTLAKFEQELAAVDQATTARFAALAEKSDEFRVELDRREVSALAAMRGRADELKHLVSQLASEFEREEVARIAGFEAQIARLREEMQGVSAALDQAQHNAASLMDSHRDRLHTDLTKVIGKIDQLDQHAVAAGRRRVEALEQESEAVVAKLAAHDAKFAENIARRQDQFDLREAQASEVLAQRLTELDEMLSERTEAQMTRLQQLVTHSSEVSAQIDQLGALLGSVTEQAEQTRSSLAGGLGDISSRLESSRQELAATGTTLSELTESGIRLLEIIQSGARETREALPAAIGKAASQLSDVEQRAVMLKGTVEAARDGGSSLSDYVITTQQSLDETEQKISSLTARLAEGADQSMTRLAAVREALGEIEGESERVSERASDELRAAIVQLEEATRHAFAALESGANERLVGLARDIGAKASAAIEQSLREESVHAVERIEQANLRVSESGREITASLRDQLAKVNELAGNLEQRVARAREQAQEQVDNDFSRRIALITESLNSNAIDISKGLSQDVTDTAWAAYLKGDRGIFTRRAVRLVDNAEAREILELYEEDDDFREHVSRYIHDFESMLRSVLSTRDGNALGVTLLSSDMGKLYVALAQSIERLRS